GRQQQQKVGQRPPSLVLGAEQVDQREQQRQSTENQSPGDQPGGEVAPLDLVAAKVGKVAEQGAEKQRHAACEQDRVERMGDASVVGMADCGHDGFLFAATWTAAQSGCAELPRVALTVHARGSCCGLLVHACPPAVRVRGTRWGDGRGYWNFSPASLASRPGVRRNR